MAEGGMENLLSPVKFKMCPDPTVICLKSWILAASAKKAIHIILIDSVFHEGSLGFKINNYTPKKMFSKSNQP